jgi:hypothetical protein
MWEEPGMTLRDYFAAASLTGIIAAEANPHGTLYTKDNSCRATLAWEHADEMLRQRRTHYLPGNPAGPTKDQPHG